MRNVALQQNVNIWALVAPHENPMSKQLAISSSFATLAMAAMALFLTPDQIGPRAGEAGFAVQAESPALDLPRPSFFAD